MTGGCVGARATARRAVLVRLATIDLAADELLAEDRGDALSAEHQHAVWRVLRAAGDARAPLVLAALAERLRRILAQLPDAATRERLVVSLPHWRDVHVATRPPDVAQPAGE